MKVVVVYLPYNLEVDREEALLMWNQDLMNTRSVVFLVEYKDHCHNTEVWSAGHQEGSEGNRV